MKIKFLDKIGQLFSKIPKLDFRELIDPKWFRLIIFVTLFVTFVIVFLIIFTNVSRKMQELEKLETQQEFSRQLEADLDIPDQNDFLFKEDFHERMVEITPYREAKEYWTEEEVENAWIDVQAEDVLKIKEQNEELIWSKLEYAP